MIEYRIVRESFHCPYAGEYTAYGIAAYRINNNFQEEIAHLSDVFIDYDQAEDLITRCNKNEIDPIHLPEIVEDAIILNSLL